jgi:hypothetical protein
MRLALAVALTLLTAESAAAGGANLPRPVPRSTGVEALRADVRFMEIVATCSDEVRAKLSFPHPRFDAYVNRIPGGWRDSATKSRSITSTSASRCAGVPRG